MDAFSPELSPHWLASSSSAADEDIDERRGDEALTPLQEAALVALADRISAARSIY